MRQCRTWITAHPASRSSFVERTLVDINNTLEQSVFAEQMAREQGLLQEMDPRLKILSALAVLLAVGLSRSLVVILVLYFLALILAAFSRIPLGFFVKTGSRDENGDVAGVSHFLEHMAFKGCAKYSCDETKLLIEGDRLPSKRRV